MKLDVKAVVQAPVRLKTLARSRTLLAQKEYPPMATPAFSIDAFKAAAEPVLADAVECNNTANLASLRDYATLFTPANLELYRLDNIFQSFVMHFPPSSFSVSVAHVRDERVGDQARMSACVGALLKAMERAPGTTLEVEIFEQEEHSVMVSRMAIAFNGPGRIPEHFMYAGRFPMTLTELSHCWTLATSGGRIELAEDGVVLRLDGMRMPPEPLELAEQLTACLGPSPRVADAERALAIIEDRGPLEPADLARVYTESVAEHRTLLHQGGILEKNGFDGAFPPLPLNRARMNAFFGALFQWSVSTAPEGGVLETLVEYNEAKREATGMISFSTGAPTIKGSFHLSIMKRAIRHHGGSVDIDVTPSEATITFTLADSVGRALDTWLPGWDAFAPDSCKYLRLLKSGAQAPPEDFILGGILEHELERWLLPRLSEPVAVNIAKDGTFRNDGLKGSIRERMQKALEQVGRGKPKKEICQPQYAGELLWAFRNDPRQRYALGTEVLTDEELQQLCEGLLAKPVDARSCLRLLALLHTRR